jgi:hypothetical protein
MNNNYEKIMQYLSDLENVECVDESEFLQLKNKMKIVENSLKNKIRPKTITVSGEMHNKIKKHCNDDGLNIGDWTEMVLNKEIDNKNKRIEVILLNLLNDFKKRIKNKDFYDYNVNKINDIIYHIKDLLWIERDKTKTIQIDLNSYLKDFDVSTMRECVYREYPGNKFVIEFSFDFFIKNIKPLNLKIGDKTSINGGEIKNLTISNLLGFNYKELKNDEFFNYIVFSFDEYTFNPDEISIKNQIDSLFGIKLDENDFKITQYNHKDEEESKMVDLKKLLLSKDNDFVHVKKHNNNGVSYLKIYLRENEIEMIKNKYSDLYGISFEKNIGKFMPFSLSDFDFCGLSLVDGMPIIVYKKEKISYSSDEFKDKIKQLFEIDFSEYKLGLMSNIDYHLTKTDFWTFE